MTVLGWTGLGGFRKAMLYVRTRTQAGGRFGAGCVCVLVLFVLVLEEGFKGKGGGMFT